MTSDGTVVDTPARALHEVRRAFPDLKAQTARELDEGWASYPYMIDESWVFRFPRADQVERQYRKERAFLPRLAPLVDIRVPNIEHVASLSDGRTFMGHRAIHGRGLSRRGLNAMSPATRSSIVDQLVGYLRTLHAFPLDEAREIGLHEGPTRDWCEELAEDARQEVFPSLSAAARAHCSTLFEQFLGDAGNFAYRAVVIHSDLGGRHVLMDETPRVVGVIDYGSVCIGDPADDFRPSLLDFGEDFGRALLAEYGHDDPDRAVRNAYFHHVAGELGGWMEGIREGAEWKVDNKRRALDHALAAYASNDDA